MAHGDIFTALCNQYSECQSGSQPDPICNFQPTSPCPYGYVPLVLLNALSYTKDTVVAPLSPWVPLFLLQTAFTTKKDYGREEREAQWAMAQRTLHGLQPPETADLFNEKTGYRELSEIAEQAKRRAEVARYLHFPLQY